MLKCVDLLVLFLSGKIVKKKKKKEKKKQRKKKKKKKEAYLCKCFPNKSLVNVGSNSQSERSNFSYGPIRAKMCLATSWELRSCRSKLRAKSSFAKCKEIELRVVK